MQNYKEASVVIRQFEELIRTNKNNIICVFYHQVKIFEMFKEREKFAILVEKFAVRKSAIVFKTSITNLIKIYPELMGTCLLLSFIKRIAKNDMANMQRGSWQI